MYIRERRPAIDDRHLIDITLNNFETTHEQTRRILRTADTVLVICNDRNQVIGYISYRWILKGFAYVDYVVLDEQYQGKGIASSLLPKVMEHALENNIYCVLGYVSLENEESLRKFQKWGFQPLFYWLNGVVIGRMLI